MKRTDRRQWQIDDFLLERAPVPRGVRSSDPMHNPVRPGGQTPAQQLAVVELWNALYKGQDLRPVAPTLPP